MALDESGFEDQLHFLSKFDLVYQKFCLSLSWSQSVDQFIALCPVNDKNQFVQLKEKCDKTTVGTLFNKRTIEKNSIVLEDNISKIVLVIFDVISVPNGKSVVQIVAQIDK